MGQRIGNDLLGTTVGFAVQHHRHAAVGHDGSNVGEVQVDERRQGDGLNDALDDLGDELVHDGERFVERKIGHEVEQSVVVEHEHGVGAASQGFQPFQCSSHALASLDVERGGDDADHEGSGSFGFFRHDGADAGSRASSQARGDENEVRTGHDALDHLATCFSAASAG